MQSQYVFGGEGSDQYLGRTISGLPITSCRNFSTLPPHYHNQVLNLTPEDWRGLVVGYDRFPSRMKSALPFLLSSIIYHKEWLNNNLHADHPIKSSLVFNDARFNREYIHLSYTNCSCGLIASGLPIQWAANEILSDINLNVANSTEAINSLNRKIEGN